jgi:glutamyl-Q tRNA(Asp) synthetase
VRIEDIDPPREQPGATDEIIRGLETYGFEWDGPVTFQSASRDAHEAAIQVLADAGMAYPCGCSRRALANAPRGALGIIYPGNCRNGCEADEFALRVRTDTTPVQFADCLQGLQSQNLEVESGDFVVLRRDGLIAYQLAVVVDDELQGITDVVRGIDLMDSTPRQIWLQRLLGYSTPGYCHLPVAINERGQKLSKSHGAPPIPLDDPADVLVSALDMLRQEPPDELKTATLQDVWQWAAENWDIEVLTGMTDIPTPENRLR